MLGWKFYSKKKKNQTETRPYHTKNDILPDEKSHKQQNKPIINPHDDYFIVEKTFWRFSITHSNQTIIKHWEDVDDEASFELPSPDDKNDDQIKNKKAVAG